MEKYIHILSSLKPEQKIDFLEKVLKNSKELQAQFINFFTIIPTKTVNAVYNFNDKVIALANEYQEALQELDLEPDYDRYHNRSDRYYEQWEMDEEAVEEVVDEFFDGIKSELIAQIKTGDIKTVMAQLTGLLIACYEAEVEDEYDCLGDSQEYFANCLKKIEKELEVEIHKTILNSEAVSETILNTMLCFKEGEANMFSTEIHDLIMTCLLSNNAESCENVYADCILNIEYKQLFPNTYLEATRITTPESWVTEAEKLCTDDVVVATNLLEYQKVTDTVRFHFNAKRLFTIFESKLVNIIADGMNDEYDSKFSKEVLSYKVKSQNKIEDYKRIANLLSSNEKNDFIAKFKSDYTYKFYIEMLETESMYKEILEYSKTYSGYLSDFENIMKSVIINYPTECFLISKPKILVSLENNMGRNYYHNVAVLLHFLLTSVKNTVPVYDLVEELCKIYSRRPALRDELRQQGLLK
jgi:hypothetical protein